MQLYQLATYHQSCRWFCNRGRPQLAGHRYQPRLADVRFRGNSGRHGAVAQCPLL